jgi:hypothetical protein
LSSGSRILIAFCSGAIFLWSKTSFSASAWKIFASTSFGYFFASAAMAFS